MIQRCAKLSSQEYNQEHSNDPQNPMNWSHAKKFFVTFEICFLTTSVYIGSAIYSAGIQDVMKVFGVGQVAATLGLTLFVAGYGLGKAQNDLDST